MALSSTSRRAFLESSLAAGVGLALAARGSFAQPVDRSRWSALPDRYPDLSRHFVFEYYPWYAAGPYRHWNEAGRQPPVDLASNYMPKLGAYDSRSTKVMEQHARWIKAAGAGSINVSWWGPGSDADRIVPALMDVMAAHDIRVTFHLEPYRDHHALSYAADIEYLIRRYGDARRWDCLLLLRHEDGASGPLFKSFRTILPETSTDCHGRTSKVADYVSDSIRREQTDRVRRTFAADFDRITLLADSLDAGRTEACGFDGIAVYDNYVRPERWREHAEACTARRLVFSFNVNPGFNGVVDRRLGLESCYAPPPFEPLSDFDWTSPLERQRAAHASERRITESFETTLALQTDPALMNSRSGFFAVYLNSFNEWHEGHQFEPMKDAAELTPEERGRGYHNPEDGAHRLNALGKLLARVLNQS
jgi:hypothetical protein